MASLPEAPQHALGADMEVYCRGKWRHCVVVERRGGAAGRNPFAGVTDHGLHVRAKRARETPGAAAMKVDEPAAAAELVAGDRVVWLDRDKDWCPGDVGEVIGPDPEDAGAMTFCCARLVTKLSLIASKVDSACARIISKSGWEGTRWSGSSKPSDSS